MSKIYSDDSKLSRRAILALAFCLVCGFAINAAAQTVSEQSQATAVNVEKTRVATKSTPTPVMTDFQKVAIGATADSVEDLWGRPKVKDSDGFLYELSNSETAQIRIGPDKKVTLIAVTFADGKGAPTLTEVFGEGATPDSNQNGTVYKMVRYPEAGYLITYYAGSGDKAMTTLTIQKL